MITFETFTTEEGIPIYLQIIRHIKRGIVSGAVMHGDEVPSRRVLTAWCESEYDTKGICNTGGRRADGVTLRSEECNVSVGGKDK